MLDKYIVLNNGVKIPQFGLGTWFIDDDKAADAVKAAAEMGYRHIDTAQAYGNERGVGEGVRNCGIPREEMFVVSKVAAEHKTYEEAMEGINETLEKMGLDYLDMMIIHSPQPWVKVNQSEDRYVEGNRAAWKALEDAYKAGKLKAIGVSNFQIGDIESLLETAEIKPMVNQILLHISNTPMELVEYCQKNGIAVEAYSPIAHGEILNQPEIKAMADKYGVTVPQLCIRYTLQLGTITLPNVSGRVLVKMKVTAPEGKKVAAHFVLKDRENNQVAEDNITLEEKDGSRVGVIDTEVGSVKAWDNHCPYLYHAYVELRSEDGEILEIIPYDIGFRRLEMIDKGIYLNGKRLVITGVNRHEWSAKTGRNISMDEMTADIDCMIRNNINAVRTCHYPDQIPWYYLCDKAGIYVMAETNMESHGTFQKLGAIEPSCSVPCSIPQWREVVVDRARSNFETFKNHTAILFWSLGNESYAGDDIEAMNTYFKEKQDGRFVHYESSFYDRNYEETISDVESRMYAKPYEVEEYLNNNPKKPYILCEYMHDMGNSMGGFGTYMKLIDKYEMYHGGFIWDFIDQALLVKDEVTGKEVLRYQWILCADFLSCLGLR